MQEVTGSIPVSSTKFLRSRTMFTTHFLEQVDSTHLFIKSLNPQVPTVVIAETQTSGRGRQGRPWISPPNQGLWMSLAHPYLKQKDFRLTEFMVRVMSVIPHRGQLGIKWPNDLVARNSQGSLLKIGGLLGEWVGDTLYIGLGINVYSAPPTEPPALPASSLKDIGISISSIHSLGLEIAAHYFEQKPLDLDPVWKWPQPGMNITWEMQVGIVEEWLPDHRLKVSTTTGSVILTSTDIHGIRYAP